MTWAEARRVVEQPRWALVWFHAMLALVQLGLFTQQSFERERMRDEIQIRAAASDRVLLEALRALGPRLE